MVAKLENFTVITKQFCTSFFILQNHSQMKNKHNFAAILFNKAAEKSFFFCAWKNMKIKRFLCQNPRGLKLWNENLLICSRSPSKRWTELSLLSWSNQILEKTTHALQICDFQIISRWNDPWLTFEMQCVMRNQIYLTFMPLWLSWQSVRFVIVRSWVQSPLGASASIFLTYSAKQKKASKDFS